jgi:DNA invertase Pin-like site-specific DNA recombinase
VATRTAAIYTRLSQDRDGSKSGTDRQEKDCRALARREGLKVVEVFTDDDRSAYNGKPRPAFERMLKELDRFDAVIYWKTDRLVRRTTQFWRVVEACENANTRLVSVVEPIDTSTPIGKGFAGVIASMGEQESHNTSLRVRRMQEDNAAAGRPHGSRRPFGYEPDGMTIRKSEAKYVRQARDRILRGESLNAICYDWNERGIKPSSSPLWRVASLRLMIKSPRIAGLYQYRGEIVGKAAWPAIISVEDRERIVAVLADRSGPKRGRAPLYLLTGFLTCGRCGAPLRSSRKGSKGDRRSWACIRTPGEDHFCGSLSIHAARVEELVEAAVLHRLEKPAVLRAMRKRPNRNGKAAAATTSMSTLEDRLVQLGKDHDDGLISRREWLERRQPLQAKIDAARADLAADAEAQVAHQFNDETVRDRWAAMTLDQRRVVLRTLIASITVLPATVYGNTFDPDRVEIAWVV